MYKVEKLELSDLIKKVSNILGLNEADLKNLLGVDVDFDSLHLSKIFSRPIFSNIKFLLLNGIRYM